MPDIRIFRDAIDGVAKARVPIKRYESELAYDLQQYGDTATSLSKSEVYIPQAVLMIEATFRFLKFIQFGDYANQRDAADLWAKAGKYRPLSERFSEGIEEDD